MGVGPGAALYGSGDAAHTGDGGAATWSATYVPRKGVEGRIQTITFCNTGGSAQLLNLALSPDGSTHTYILQDESLPAGESFILHGNPYLVLAPGTTLELACNAVAVDYSIHLTEKR
jgi:hypothetical protein